MIEYLVDTNVGLRFAERSDTQHMLARNAIKKLISNGDLLYVAPQNIIEAWNVSTRPLNRNGYGRTIKQVRRTARLLERTFRLLPDSPLIYRTWLELVTKYKVSGVQVHDARLVAVMLVHGVSHILTFNTTDFARYAPEGIVAIDPSLV